MALRLGLLRTRVARRILGLFIVGALVPVIVMAVISFGAVDRQLGEQSHERLQQLAGNAGQSVMQQLQLTHGALQRLVVLAAAGTGDSARFRDATPGSVEALALADDAGALRELVGSLSSVPTLDTLQLAHLRTGRAVLTAYQAPRNLIAALALDPARLDRGILWARLAPDSIWAAGVAFTELSTRMDFCVLGEGDALLYCSSGRDEVAASFQQLPPSEFSARSNQEARGVVQHDSDGVEVLTGYRRLPLKSEFALSQWTVLYSEAHDTVNRPLDGFRYSFPLALLLGVLTVIFVANTQVRRTMNPLEALEAGTQKVAAGDLSARVPVTSTDEFGALASSFNRMAAQLGLQVRQLEARRAIDDAVLRAVAREEVVSAVLSHFESVVASTKVCLALVQDEAHGTGHLWQWHDSREGEHKPVRFTKGNMAWIRAQPHHRMLPDHEHRPDFMRMSGSGEVEETWVVLPLMVGDQVRGVLWYLPEGGGLFDASAVARAREITDQATVALDDLRVTEELEELSWGTLRALARAIDAKSQWTAGHSERVTELALELGLELGLGERDLDLLSRGGLLHDVGKIGVPARLLDEPGSLSKADRALIEEHPVIGFRILEPIRAFAAALPIVVQHHEKWDGTGYPAGLKGEEIDPLARVLAVADVYDAMASPRPYRNPIDPVTVVTQIHLDSGTHFEPRVADAFLAVMARKGVVPNLRTGGYRG